MQSASITGEFIAHKNPNDDALSQEIPWSFRNDFIHQISCNDSIHQISCSDSIHQISCNDSIRIWPDLVNHHSVITPSNAVNFTATSSETFQVQIISSCHESALSLEVKPKFFAVGEPLKITGRATKETRISVTSIRIVAGEFAKFIHFDIPKVLIPGENSPVLLANYTVEEAFAEHSQIFINAFFNSEPLLVKAFAVQKASFRLYSSPFAAQIGSLVWLEAEVFGKAKVSLIEIFAQIPKGFSDSRCESSSNPSQTISFNPYLTLNEGTCRLTSFTVGPQFHGYDTLYVQASFNGIALNSNYHQIVLVHSNSLQVPLEETMMLELGIFPSKRFYFTGDFVQLMLIPGNCSIKTLTHLSIEFEGRVIWEAENFTFSRKQATHEFLTNFIIPSNACLPPSKKSFAWFVLEYHVTAFQGCRVNDFPKRFSLGISIRPGNEHSKVENEDLKKEKDFEANEESQDGNEKISKSNLEKHESNDESQDANSSLVSSPIKKCLPEKPPKTDFTSSDEHQIYSKKQRNQSTELNPSPLQISAKFPKSLTPLELAIFRFSLSSSLSHQVKSIEIRLGGKKIIHKNTFERVLMLIEWIVACEFDSLGEVTLEFILHLHTGKSQKITNDIYVGHNDFCKRILQEKIDNHQ